ncbi:hypothetical protein REPUB_Repub12eG0085300 [Reevesia pubescens]
MATLSSQHHPFSPAVNRPPAPNLKPIRVSTVFTSKRETSAPNRNAEEEMSSITVSERRRENRGLVNAEELKQREARERKEEVNRKIASRKAISVILRREATKALIEKKRGPNNSKKLLPRTVLEALHERITALRWDSALKLQELPPLIEIRLSSDRRRQLLRLLLLCLMDEKFSSELKEHTT